MIRRLILIGALALAACSEPPAPPVNIEDRDQVRAVVRDYLVNDPALLDEALTALQARRDAIRIAEIQSDGRDFVIGRADAPVTIVEFFDYRCPYCHSAATWVFETAAARDDVRVVFKEFPILGPDSLEASRAAIASIKQGRYRQFHLAMMGHRGELNGAAIDELARRIGIDVARMRRDMADPAIDQIIENNHRLAQESGVNGTPTFLINGVAAPRFDPALLRDRINQAAQEARSEG